MSRLALVGGVVLGVFALGGCTPEGTVAPDPPTPSPVAMSPTLYHCGINPITYRGQRWEAEEPPFDATNKPNSWRGHGRMIEVSPTRLLYTDDSGVEVSFLPDAEVPPRLCR